MSATVSSIPANQDRPLLLPSPLPSDQRSAAGRRMLTLLDLLTVDKIDGLDRRADEQSEGDDAAGEGGGGAVNRWRFLKERLGLIKIVGGCCGGVADTWRFNSSPPRIIDDERRNREAAVVPEEEARSSSRRSSGVNLAAALAAEREYRTGEEEEEVATPSRVSLMRLLEETAENRGEKKEEVKEEEEEEEEEVVVVVGEGGSENEGVCCVCMGRKKGAALIPCGHTYCRKCSHHLWLQRRSCPLCNHPILEILHIF